MSDIQERILDSLEEKPRSISEIARQLDEEEYQISKEIERMDEQGAINTHKVGRSSVCILAEGRERGEKAISGEDVSGEVSREDVDSSVEEEVKELSKPRTIGIVSGKGGVGKTVVTLNLGVALMEFGEKVIVMDADAEMPNLGIHLGIHTTPTSLQQVVEQDVHIMSAMQIDKDSGLRVIPTSLATEKFDGDIQEALGKIPAEYTVLIDSPPGYERPVERVVENCDELLFVTTPEIPSLSDTYRLYREAREKGKSVIGVVVNMYDSPKDHLSIQEVEKVLDIPVIGVIPKHNHVQRSILENEPLVSRKPYIKPSREFKNIASDITGYPYEETLAEKIKGWLP
ncbi:MAG: P-loop NTPase [Candidatus Nanohaloarchaeota archaeon QJJ-7]|nr:P-loop NTPase [Candidatus Nanohaloarchaeota archaeon QJJ-7]